MSRFFTGTVHVVRGGLVGWFSISEYFLLGSMGENKRVVTHTISFLRYFILNIITRSFLEYLHAVQVFHQDVSSLSWDS